MCCLSLVFVVCSVRVASCSMFVVCWLLIVVRGCLVFAVCGWLVIRCPLFVAGCLLSDVCCTLCVLVVCCCRLL